MQVVHLMASPFFGGPEKQMLGLAVHLPARYRNVFLTFAEKGHCQALLDQVHAHGLEGIALEYNTPKVRRAAAEVARHLRRLEADVLVCSGYKPDVVGWLAARQAGVPVVAVAHGWTGATFKVRLYEKLDRFLLRWMDAVVCVSAAQADKVRAAGVAAHKIRTIANAVGADAFTEPDPEARHYLERMFSAPPRRIVAGAGRLSPEKGFVHFVEAAARLKQTHPEAAFVLFGEGPLRQELTDKIAALGLQDRFLLPGFRTDLARLWSAVDVAVLPSYTEGLPVMVLEACAAGVPVVATAVGGTPEVVHDGVNGFLTSPGDAPALAERIAQLLDDETRRRAMGEQGRQRVKQEFSFARQCEQYEALFAALVRKARRPRASALVG